MEALKASSFREDLAVFALQRTDNELLEAHAYCLALLRLEEQTEHTVLSSSLDQSFALVALPQPSTELEAAKLSTVPKESTIKTSQVAERESRVEQGRSRLTFFQAIFYYYVNAHWDWEQTDWPNFERAVRPWIQKKKQQRKVPRPARVTTSFATKWDTVFAQNQRPRKPELLSTNILSRLHSFHPAVFL